MRPRRLPARNVGPGERWARAGLGLALLLLGVLVSGRAIAWILALLGLGLLATAWASY